MTTASVLSGGIFFEGLNQGILPVLHYPFILRACVVVTEKVQYAVDYIEVELVLQRSIKFIGIAPGGINGYNDIGVYLLSADRDVET